MKKLEKLLKESNYARKQMKDDSLDGAFQRWENKDIIDSITLSNFDSLDDIVKPSYGEISISNEVSFNNTSSLQIKVNTDIENVKPRPWCNFKVNFKETDLSNYNRISLYVFPKIDGFHNFYFHFSLGNKGKEVLHAVSLIPNMWNHVFFEIGKVERDKVSQLSISPFIGGCPPEGEDELNVFFSNLTAQKVQADYDEGWELEDRIAYSHCGYLLNEEKIAFTGNAVNKTFSLRDNNNNIVYEGVLEEERSHLGKYYIADFSLFKEEGEYLLKIDNRYTNYFLISDNAYDSSIWKSLNFLRALRCGQNIEGVHSECHQNCRSVNSDNQSVPNFGGWHDAGDLSQFEICTAEMTHALLDIAITLNDNDVLKERILEEAKVGLDWILKTKFPNGERALAVSYSIWRKNILLEDNDLVKMSKAENSPFENFIASACEAKGAILFNDDLIYARWLTKSAIIDFKDGIDGLEKGIYSKRWGPSITPQVYGAALLALSELYILTHDKEYEKYVSLFADKIIACQEVNLATKGFFYEDENHSMILSYEHRGHEQSPIQGLIKICEVFKNHPDYNKWIKAIDLYKDYITSSMKVTYPFNLLPAGVYDVNKINPAHFTIPTLFCNKEDGINDLKNQVTKGIKLQDNLYLRIMPIAVQRRGFFATLLSKTKAVSMIAKFYQDDNLKQIALDQLKWILGRNPFASSCMYGEGYNYHPLYVAFSSQIIGALPVGIMTYKDHDAPYWPVIDNAVYKEIWGHTTGKYLWVLADLL